MQIIIREPVLFSLEHHKFVITSPNSLIFREDPPVAEDDGVPRGTVSEGVLAGLDARLRNPHCREFASRKALLLDVLEGVRQCDALKIPTILERICANFP